MGRTEISLGISFIISTLDYSGQSRARIVRYRLHYVKYEPQNFQKRGLFEKFQHKNAIKSIFF